METLATLAPLVNALGDDGSLDPAEALHLSDELAVALYDHMVLSRIFRESVATLERASAIGPCASKAREEGAALGSVSAMRDEDWVFLGGSDVAAALWRGVPLDSCARHALGTRGADGQPAEARNGPASFRSTSAWKEARVVTASRSGAAQVPHAVGLAWAARLRKSDDAALVLFGDGATSSADFHSGLNFAGVTRAPLIALCCSHGEESRSTAAGTTARPIARSGFAASAVAYGLRGVRVDGTDIVAVRSVVREARERAASGLGGTLVEAVIPAGDGADPLVRLAQYLRARGLWEEERQKGVAVETRSDVERALAAATAAAPPERHTLFDDVYAELPWHLREQTEEAGAER